MSVSALLGVFVTNWLFTMSFWEWGAVCRSSSPRKQVFPSGSIRLILTVGVSDQSSWCFWASCSCSTCSCSCSCSCL